MAFLRRKRKERYTAPPPPPAELEEKVREVETTAEHQLNEARERDPEVERRHERTRRISRENALGQKFWQAVGEHRGS